MPAAGSPPTTYNWFPRPGRDPAPPRASARHTLWVKPGDVTEEREKRNEQ
jgi:hypothetical protein